MKSKFGRILATYRRRVIAATAITVTGAMAMAGGTASAHKTCDNTSHSHGTAGWVAQVSGSGFNTIYDWYSYTTPSNPVYQGWLQCPYG